MIGGGRDHRTHSQKGTSVLGISIFAAAIPVGAAALHRRPRTMQNKNTVFSRKDLPWSVLVQNSRHLRMREVTPSARGRDGWRANAKGRMDKFRIWIDRTTTDMIPVPALACTISRRYSPVSKQCTMC